LGKKERTVPSTCGRVLKERLRGLLGGEDNRCTFPATSESLPHARRQHRKTRNGGFEKRAKQERITRKSSFPLHREEGYIGVRREKVREKNEGGTPVEGIGSELSIDARFEERGRGDERRERKGIGFPVRRERSQKRRNAREEGKR